MTAGERACPTCPPDDNRWPAAEFAADPAGRQCTACWMDTRKTRRPCSTKGCTRRIITYRGVEEPRCLPCRRRLRGLLDFAAARAAKAQREGYAKRVRRPCTGCGARTESTTTCPAPLCVRCRYANQTTKRAA